jgi:hypothetical protein
MRACRPAVMTAVVVPGRNVEMQQFH